MSTKENDIWLENMRDVSEEDLERVATNLTPLGIIGMQMDIITESVKKNFKGKEDLDFIMKDQETKDQVDLDLSNKDNEEDH
jgi:hypothetical protein